MRNESKRNTRGEMTQGESRLGNKLGNETWENGTGRNETQAYSKG